MNTGIKTRYAERDDIYQISVFINDCWKVAYCNIISADYLNAMSVEARNTAMLKRFDSSTSDFLMMFDGDRLIGAAVFGKSFTDGYEQDGEISAIYLCDDCIGKGYGRQLCMLVEQALCAKGYEHLVLDVLSDNTRAINFYQALGFRTVAYNSIRLGETDYPLTIMRKEAGG